MLFQSTEVMRKVSHRGIYRLISTINITVLLVWWVRNTIITVIFSFTSIHHNTVRTRIAPAKTIAFQICSATWAPVRGSFFFARTLQIFQNSIWSRWQIHPVYGHLSLPVNNPTIFSKVWAIHHGFSGSPPNCSLERYSPNVFVEGIFCTKGISLPQYFPSRKML